MLTPRSPLTRRVAAALDATPSRIPVLLGGCGSGRTTLLQQLHDERIDRAGAQYINVERTATTPERFLRAITAATSFTWVDTRTSGTRGAFDAALSFFDCAHASNGPALFLLDEFLELRTFESFPGLRRAVRELIDRLAASGNRFVLTSRYIARSLRLLRDHTARFEIVQIPPLATEETMDVMGLAAGALSPDGAHDAEYAARAVQALGDGRPAYVSAIADQLASRRELGVPGAADPVSALAALLAVDGKLWRQCSFCYELRLHRARGYGALKAILDILAEEEGLTLTEISQRLQRTPGSTKDYLSWLEDVDLVTSRQKRYSFTDPLLRLWVRLHCRPAAPSDDDLAREIHSYALPRLPPQPQPAMAVATGRGRAADDERKAWGIIEID